MWLMRSKSWYDMLNWPLSSWLPILAGLVGLIVLIWLIVRLIARVNEDTDPAEADREMLLTLSDLRREGDLTQEEFRSIKSRLVQRMSATDDRFPVHSETAISAELKSVPVQSSGAEKNEEVQSSAKSNLSAPIDEKDQTTDIGDQTSFGSPN